MGKTNRNSNKKRGCKTRKGGSALPPSAWGWQTANLGSGWDQFMNTFSINPADNLGTVNSNEIVPMGKPNAEDSQPMLSPNMKETTMQQGGKKKSKKVGKKMKGNKKVHTRKGGNIMSIVSKAIVPASLFAMQRRALNNKYKKSKKSKK